jgi:uncharacterized protein YacL
MLVIRMVFLVVLVTASLLPYFGVVTRRTDFTLPEVVIFSCVMFVFGALIIAADARTPHKRLSTLFAISIGIIVGLTGAWAMGLIVDLVADAWDLTGTEKWRAYIGVIKIALGVSFCYLAVAIILTTKDDFRLIIPYVEFAKHVRGVRPMAIDTSVLIDGRIINLGETSFLDAPLVVPSFVIDELQTLADSGDKLKRERGRRGLAMLTKLQSSPFVDVTIDDTRVDGRSVDHMLLELAAQQNMRVLTTDYNLSKVGQIRGVSVLNLNDIAGSLKTQVVPGETIELQIVKPGEGPQQGVGYLDDGTMVVVEDGIKHLKEVRAVVVTNSLQTSAGRLVFARLAEREGNDSSDDAGASASHDSADRIESLAHTATNQPRTPVRTETGDPRDSASRRNPRR